MTAVTSVPGREEPHRSSCFADRLLLLMLLGFRLFQDRAKSRSVGHGLCGTGILRPR